MPSADQTYLYHNLAKVSTDLADTEQALVAYKEALKRPLKLIRDSLTTGELSLNDEDLIILDDFFKYCDSLSLTDEASKIRESLESVKNNDKTSPEVILKIDLLILKFLKISADKNDVIHGYEDVLQRSRKRFGPLSQPVQDIYIEYAKTLQQLGAKKDVLTVIKGRLSELSPNYSSQLLTPKTDSQSRPLLQRVLNRMQNPKKKTLLAQSVFENATTYYNQGEQDSAYKEHHIAAKLGNIESIFTLGTYYQLGIGCDINMANARKHYLRAAKMGHLNAQHHYAALLQSGLGGEVDFETAVLWYKQASMSGHTTATMNLAYLYVSTLIGGPFYAVGIATFLRAYELGSDEALPIALQYLATPIALLRQN